MQEDEQIAAFWVKHCLCFPFLLAHPWWFFVWNLPRRSAESILGRCGEYWLLLPGDQLFILDGMGFFWRLDLEQVHLFMTACPS